MRYVQVLIATALLAGVIGVTTAEGTKHSHSVTVLSFINKKTMPPASDPVTNGVVTVSVTCPKGYTATGGGFEAPLARVSSSDNATPRTWFIVAVNQSNSSQTVSVTAVCIKGRTSAVQAKRSGRSPEQLVNAERQARRNG
jgi:hypothetical protein